MAGRLLAAGLLEDLVAHKYRHFGPGLPVRRGSTLVPAQSDLRPLMLREVAPRQVRLTIDLHEDDLREIHPPLTTDKSAFLLINKTAPATYLRPPPRTAPPEATRRPICPQFGQTIRVSMNVTTAAGGAAVRRV